jgi:hypothetical protein
MTADQTKTLYEGDSQIQSIESTDTKSSHDASAIGAGDDRSSNTVREAAAQQGQLPQPTTIAGENAGEREQRRDSGITHADRRNAVATHSDSGTLVKWAEQLTTTEPLGEQQLAAHRAAPLKSILRKQASPELRPGFARRKPRPKSPPPPDTDGESEAESGDQSGADEKPMHADPNSPRRQDDTIVGTRPLPLIGEPPRFEREILLPVAEDFKWPEAKYFCFYEHNGAFMLSLYEWSRGAVISCADRRSTRPPPPGCYHFIGKVQEFVDAYPYSLGLVISHVTCAPAAAAATLKLPERIQDGSFRTTALEILWTLHLGACAAAEQPATNAHHILGPPSFVTNATKHGGRRHKVFTWWTRGLSHVLDGEETPASLLLPRLSGSNAEKRMLRRTETPLSLARSHAAVWVDNLEEALANDIGPGDQLKFCTAVTRRQGKS